MTNLANCRFCKRPYNAEFCTQEEHEKYCPENPAHWEVVENSRQLVWAIFWVLAAMAVVVAIMSFVSRKTDYVVFDMSDCVASTSAAQGFTGDAKEQWDLFAEGCSEK